MDSQKKSIDIRETQLCAFCSITMNKNLNLLDCLHFICNECLLNIPERENSGVECKKCEVVTQNGDIIEYPTIMPPDVFQSTFCSKDNCNNTAKNICVNCKDLFCTLCSQIHKETTKDHIPIIREKDFKICFQCNVKTIEVYCDSCSLLLCSLCQLKEHRLHKFRILSNIGNELKSHLNMHLKNFEFNVKYCDQNLNETNKFLSSLEDKRKLAITHIDKTILLLHEQVNQHASNLKRELNTKFQDIHQELEKNKITILKSKESNLYYDKLIKITFNQDKVMDVVKIAKPFMDKFLKAKSKLLETSIDLKQFQCNLEFNSEETLIDGLLAIQKVGTISSSMNIIPGNQESSSSFQHEQSYGQTVQVVDRQTSINSFLNECVNNAQDIDKSNYVAPKNCACCNQWVISDFFSCVSCSRLYHNACHIPPLVGETILRIGNECTLCKSLSTYIRRLNEKDISYIDLPIGKSERKILERLLLELYCHNVHSDNFQYLPSIKMYRDFYDRIFHPISLNDIKNSLQTDKAYSLSRGISEMKLIFSNAMKYFPRSDPNYISARYLENCLNIMIIEFIPKVHEYYSNIRPQ